jgi:hypothetical protein
MSWKRGSSRWFGAREASADGGIWRAIVCALLVTLSCLADASIAGAEEAGAKDILCAGAPKGSVVPRSQAGG